MSGIHPKDPQLIQKIHDSDLFDPDWYLRQYPDVRLLGMDPAEHYQRLGGLLRRDPGPDFSAEFYINTHRSVQKKMLNPLLHYLSRKPTPHANPESAKVLWAAGLDSIAGHTERAVKLAEEYLPSNLAHGIALLRANDAVRRNDSEAWLAEVNGFLDHFDVARITLNAARVSATLFERLSTDELPQIHQGPVVSVIMPAWNAAKTVEQAIRSILGQTWRPIELIVVDDASSDDTWQIISRLAQTDSRLKPLRNTQNVGPYVSKNIALNYATGLWITGHDADDWAHPQRVESHVRYLMSEGRIASLMGMLRMSANGTFARLSPLGPNTLDGACVAGFISMMCDRNFFSQKIGHWDEMRFGGDSELIHRIEQAMGRTMKRFHSIGMFCLDNPEGLTNHPEFGHKPGIGIAPERKEYKANFLKWHDTLESSDIYLDFPQTERRFPAPQAALNAPGTVAMVYRAHIERHSPVSDRELSADVCWVTNLRFPGGNASSTLDELRHFQQKGLQIRLVHCPVDKDLGKPISERFHEHGFSISIFSDFVRLKCKTLIVRHPAVITSNIFKDSMHKLEAESAYCVINNSQKRTSGEPVYSIEELMESATRIPAGRVQVCPISPVMRGELTDVLPDSLLSDLDWTPTFDLESYQHPPRPTLTPPYTIGRHGRDGAEKWLEDRALLRKAFPDDPDFRIEVLGGAKNAASILGGLPENWTVHDFGSITPKEYLKNLDVFVYFPNSSLNEGFGRTIAEAMIASVPCILPPKFEEVFSDLAFYCPTGGVVPLIRELGRHDRERMAFLKEVQDIVDARFSTSAIEARFPEWSAGEDGSNASVPSELSEASKAFRQAVMQQAKECSG